MCNDKTLRRFLFPNTDEFQIKDFIFWKPCHTGFCLLRYNFLRVQSQKGKGSQTRKAVYMEIQTLCVCWSTHMVLFLHQADYFVLLLNCLIPCDMAFTWFQPKPHPLFWKVMHNGQAESESTLRNFNNVSQRTQGNICRSFSSVPEITVLSAVYFPGWFAVGLFPVKLA